jgi:hypothetical protein
VSQAYSWWSPVFRAPLSGASPALDAAEAETPLIEARLLDRENIARVLVIFPYATFACAIGSVGQQREA